VLLIARHRAAVAKTEGLLLAEALAGPEETLSEAAASRRASDGIIAEMKLLLEAALEEARLAGVDLAPEVATPEVDSSMVEMTLQAVDTPAAPEGATPEVDSGMVVMTPAMNRRGRRAAAKVFEGERVEQAGVAAAAAAVLPGAAAVQCAAVAVQAEAFALQKGLLKAQADAKKEGFVQKLFEQLRKVQDAKSRSAKLGQVLDMLEMKRESLFTGYGMTPEELEFLMQKLNDEFAPAVVEPAGSACDPVGVLSDFG
jgi:hypothetical protein